MQLQLFARISIIRHFINTVANGSGLLLLATVLALFLANSPLAPIYFHCLETQFAGLNIEAWVNDGLMAIFFFLVGLEIKREILKGELSSWSLRILPGIAAIAGMLTPAMIFLALNYNVPGKQQGWAIPAATDIAFALGVLAVLGNRIPASLKILLTAIAVIDDLLAILVIALFYTAEIHGMPLLLALAGLLALIFLNKKNVRVIFPYLLLGILVWVGFLFSGIHATLAGVVVAMTIPLRRNTNDGASPLETLEHALQSWVSYFILPVFALANAGLSLSRFSLELMLSSLPLGIALALFVGKQAGIFTAIWTLAKTGWVTLPSGISWQQVYGMSVICGIGFTMSLFIGHLAFEANPELMDSVKIGVFSGSLVSALLGVAVLRLASKPVPENS